MKVFVLKALYFLLPLILVSIAADYFISGSLRKSKTFASGEYSTWNDLYEGKINADIVIYGSSRAVVQINPILLGDSLNGSCYNLGIDGHNFWAQHFRHEEFLKHNKKPDVIIHSLDATSLTDRGNLYNAEQFLPYMLLDASIESFTKPYQTLSYFDFRLPLLRYLGKRTTLFHAASLFFRDQPQSVGRLMGYEPHDIPWNNDLAKARSQAPAYEVLLDTGAVSLFKRYLDFCNRENIKVIFVYTPQYIEGQRFIKNIADILNFYRSLSVQYEVAFFDYSNDPICYNRSYFYNSNHLNKAGSTLFTSRLAHDLKRAAIYHHKRAR